jgi:hypothetical protein
MDHIGIDVHKIDTEAGTCPAAHGGTRGTAAAWEQNGSSRDPSGKS